MSYSSTISSTRFFHWYHSLEHYDQTNLRPISALSPPYLAQLFLSAPALKLCGVGGIQMRHRHYLFVAKSLGFGPHSRWSHRVLQLPCRGSVFLEGWVLGAPRLARRSYSAHTNFPLKMWTKVLSHYNPRFQP
jgi:hypothetical protein